MTTGKTTSTCDPHIVEWTASSQQGWECPRCGKIWAPWISSCTCKRSTTTTTTTVTWDKAAIATPIDPWTVTVGSDTIPHTYTMKQGEQ